MKPKVYTYLGLSIINHSKTHQKSFAPIYVREIPDNVCNQGSVSTKLTLTYWCKKT